MDEEGNFEQTWLPYASNELNEMWTLLQQGEFLSDEKQKILKDIIDELTKQINLWNFHKLRAQVGWPVPPPLDDLQPICDKVVLVLLKQMEQYANEIFQPRSEEIYDMFMEKYNEKKRLLSTFIRSCLVIEKQPDQTVIIRRIDPDKKKNQQGDGQNFMKVDVKYTYVSLRLLIGKHCLHSPPTDVICCLYLENQLNFDEEGNQQSSNNSVDGNSHKFQTIPFKEKNGVYKADLKERIVIPERKSKESDSSSDQRPKTKASVHVADLKSCFIFTTQLTLVGQLFTLQAVSVPFVELSNISYDRHKVQALLFWDNAFAAQDRKLFDVPDAVPVNDFLKALNNYWSKWVDAGLTEQHLLHIKSRFCVFPEFRNNPNLVTKEMFNQLIMCQKADTISDFSFWKWFFEIVMLVHNRLKVYWKNGHIKGFIAKQDAMDLLRYKQEGTFLLRFSDSSLPSVVGGISVTCKVDESTVDGCISMSPWTEGDLKKIPLNHRISEEPRCRFLYPSLKVKGDVFTTEKKKTHPGYPCWMSESVTFNASPPRSLMDVDECPTDGRPSWQQMPPKQEILIGDPFMGVPIQCVLDNRMNQPLQI